MLHRAVCRGTETKLSIPFWLHHVTFPFKLWRRGHYAVWFIRVFDACITLKINLVRRIILRVWRLSICLRYAHRGEIIFGASPPLNAIYENNNISAGPWPTPMPRFIGLDWRWIYDHVVRTINKLAEENSICHNKPFKRNMRAEECTWDIMALTTYTIYREEHIQRSNYLFAKIIYWLNRSNLRIEWNYESFSLP